MEGALSGFRWWRRGDLDGFFGLFVDNLIQLILIVALCGGLLRMPDEMVFGRILPGVAVSLLAGNIFYAIQAKRLAMRTGAADVTALPYGVNTVSLFGYVFFVMLPVLSQTNDPELAWRAGLVACLGSGVIEFGGAYVAGWVKRVTPRAALLATLAGIAITFISMDFCLRLFDNPLVGFAPLALILMQYVGRMRLPLGIPAGFAAVIVGTVLAWLMGDMDHEALKTSMHMSLTLPIPYIGELARALGSDYMIAFLPIILPMGLFNLIGSLQNLESAEAAGDRYPVRSSLAVNGVGTIVAACFGSCFPTTIYIGHPGWKGMGAGAGYSVANGVVVSILCFLGLVGFVTALVPVEAGAAILLWIAIIIASQAFQVTPRKHAPAVVVGLFPAFAAWGLLMVSTALRVAGTNIVQVGLPAFAGSLPINGMIALERGFIFTSMILAAMTVALIDGRFKHGTVWAMVAALVSATGLMHGYDLSAFDIVNAYGPSYTWPFVIGYTAMAVMFLVLGALGERHPEHIERT